jgi:purine-binding chemotaxis protein CheW
MHLPYLIFSLNQSRYGIEAIAVEEIFFLPELTPLTEAPKEIAGLLNLRGNIIPIVDLKVRLGYRWRSYSLTDTVIVVQCRNSRMGFIVDSVHEVQNISGATTAAELAYPQKHRSGQDPQPNTLQQTTLVCGVVQVDEALVLLLDLDQLIEGWQPDKPKAPPFPNAGGETDNSALPESLELGMQLSPEEQQIFRHRAKNLRLSSQTQELGNLMSLAVVELGGEYFGIDLHSVREFTDVRQITPIPCTPRYIIGNMNLRGEIVTLVAIRGLLNLPIRDFACVSKAIVVEEEDLVAGITVDEVFDVVHLHPEDIAPMPTIGHLGSDEYLKGTAFYKDRAIGILDVAKILTKGDLMVDEEI